jgi:hypothetical protein
MPLLLMLAILAATATADAIADATGDAPRGAIEATIRGTMEPLEVDLLLRNPTEEWTEVDHEHLVSETRRVRFDNLSSGVYQLRVRGPVNTEQLGTKIVLGRNDTRDTTIDIEPFLVTGRVTLGGTELGNGVIVLRHRELHWRAGIAIADDGTFRAPLWQRGAFTYSIRSLALPTEYAYAVDLDGTASSALNIDIPDGRITGIVRDAKSGAPISGTLVTLQTNLNEREEHVKLTTGPDGRFDFTGIKYGRHTVRIYPPHHLEPAPLLFTLGDNARLRELDVPVDPGRAVPIVVIDHDDHPVANARVFTVSESKLRARITTDEDGRATVAVPSTEAATLFVIPEEGPFGILRVERDQQPGLLQRVQLPPTSSSLLIRALTLTGATLPPFSLLMRYNGELVPPDVAEELTTLHGLQFMTGPDSEAHFQNLPVGSYEFWPYRTPNEAQSIMASADALMAPIQVKVRAGENKIAVRFAAKP